MSSIHSSIGQPYGSADDFDHSADREDALVRRLRRGLIIIGALAFGVLVIQGLTAPERTAAERAEALKAPVAGEVFDGRGKWAGYAR